MKQLLSYIILFAMALTSAPMLTSCTDDIEYVGGEIEEGVSVVNAEVSFKAFTPALESRSDGDAMKYINTLWLVIYDRNGNYIRHQQVTNFKTKVEEARPGEGSSEATTGCAKFDLTIENGYYRIYVVANHDMSDVAETDIDEIAKLKRLDLEWKSGDVTQNAQMFGWLINGSKDDDHGTDAPLVAIRNNNSSLHAWVRRAASKVTIAFNTNNLNEYVKIYIKSVTIKDIPTHCYLSDENAPGDDNYTLSSELIDGETIYFGSAKETDKGKDNHGNWPVIRSGDRVYGLYSDRSGRLDNADSMELSELIAREHSEEAPALYFYENMQGQGISGTESDKRQDVTGASKQVSYPDGIYTDNKAWKDAKPYGTYVEVKGYYENIGSLKPGRGDITYRFMLGKDHITDYDAERNHHYKVTMNFNGNANDIDFHIDYKEEARPGFMVQDTTYVSYLYRQRSHTIIRATPKAGYDLLTLEAYILDNEWRPHNVPDAEAQDLYNLKAWKMQIENKDDYSKTVNGYPRPDFIATWTDIDGQTHTDASATNTEFGFLSLREIKLQTYEMGGAWNKTKELVSNLRKQYFHGGVGNTGNNPLENSFGHRYYREIPNTNGSHVVDKGSKDGEFDIHRQENGNTCDYILEVPLFTRAMSIDSWAVYSGANPFYDHYRYARVRFIATYKKVDPKVDGPSQYQESDQTIVLQSQRIINPRTIYRSYNNKESFVVSLCYSKLTPKATLDKDKNPVVDTKTEIFQPIISDGPWSATIESDPNGIVSISANGRTITKVGQSITGRNNTPVEFTYRPVKDAPKDGSYGAIITVYYNGNNCSHKIVVNQGFGPTQMIPNGPKWSAFNVFDKDHLTINPLNIGNTFRRQPDLDEPISEINNEIYKVHDIPSGNLILYDHMSFADYDQTRTYKENNKDGKLSDVKRISWGNMRANTTGSQDAFTSMHLYNCVTDDYFNYRLPTPDEYPQLGIYKDKTNTPANETQQVLQIGNGFGVCYGDGARRTLLTQEAYSFYDPTNTVKRSHRGVRGLVIYNINTGNNIFFPLGRWGHPRRRRNGELQYGSVDVLLDRDNVPSDPYRPMAYALRYQTGAAYWTSSTDNTHVALDFNAGNYMTSYLNHGDVFQTDDTKADALPIKPIRVE
ncbi:MAG: hypothetical protein NC336_07475 [Clostridium sp.]|nr:hypothetical protein [Clostridium sp.]